MRDLLRFSRGHDRGCQQSQLSHKPVIPAKESLFNFGIQDMIRPDLDRSRPLQEKAPSPDINSRSLALLRIGVGVFFLIFGEYKVFGTQFTLHGGFQYWINRFLEGGAYPFMAPVLRGFVLAHATPIAFLVAYGELAIGIALVCGIFVRSASACGLLFMLTLLFSSDYPGASAPFWQYFGASLSHSVFMLCFAAFLLGRADAVWSVKNLRAHQQPTTRGPH